MLDAGYRRGVEMKSLADLGFEAQDFIDEKMQE